ncbi:MAG: hypothetical protein J7555_11075 [Chloroflexi bacterium]|nr:hypothetical protein [Chloroflexota bacterium]
MEKRNPTLSVFTIVLSLLYGVIASGQILGFCKLYKSFLAIPLSLGLAVVVFIIYKRSSNQFLDSFNHETGTPENTWLTTAFIISGLLLYILLVFYPLVHWPYSPISTKLNWDAGLYHFPKAAEMISTGSAWDLSIAYGEYPFGYESLIALSLLINHSGLLIGTVHALISLFLLLVMGLLIFQRTKISQAPVFLLLSMLFLGYRLARDFDGNIWWIFWPQITLIGKNDVLLAAALLAVLLHTPASRQGPFFPFGLAVASMVAISVKPNAALTVLFAWVVMLFFLWRSRKLQAHRKQLLLSGFVILPGGLWIIRNLVVQGLLFSPGSMRLSTQSIASNLTNPYFYKYIPSHLYIVLAIIVLAALVSVFKRSLRYDVIVVLVLLITFALTPASAFSGSTQERAQIAWRFAMALLAYILVLLMALFEPVILPVYRWIARKNFVAIPLALLVLAFGSWCVWSQRDLLATYPENEIVLHDQYRQSVGVDGYHSAYDYVQKNVRNSVVIIENGLPYYLYDPEFTNSVTRSRPADYIVYLRTSWINEGGYPETLNQPEWSQTWLLVYEDAEGRVYKRR